MKTVVEDIVYDYISQYFIQHPEEFEKIYEKVDLSARGRLAAVIAKETVMRKTVLG